MGRLDCKGSLSRWRRGSGRGGGRKAGSGIIVKPRDMGRREKRQDNPCSRIECVCGVTRFDRTSRAESQWIVATRLLYHVQYPVAAKSSANDLSRRRFRVVLCYPHGCFARSVSYTCGFGPKVYCYAPAPATLSLSSMDSDLEAFSHNPTDGSVSPLAFQLSENANYLNQRFLSY